MTTYGTNPTSSSHSGTPVNMSRANERLRVHGVGERRPWRHMFQFHSLGLPKSFREAAARIKTNSGYFRMNYAIIVLLIVFLSLLWHPIALMVFVAMMAVWLFLYFLRDEPLVVFGRLITDGSVLFSLSILTFEVLQQTDAITNTDVSLLVGAVVVLIHAAVRKTDDLFFDEEEAAGGFWMPSSRPASRP